MLTRTMSRAGTRGPTIRTHRSPVRSRIGMQVSGLLRSTVGKAGWGWAGESLEGLKLCLLDTPQEVGRGTESSFRRDQTSGTR